MKTLTSFSLLILFTLFMACGGSSTDSDDDTDNTRPDITSLASATAIEDSLFSYTVTFTDTDGPDTVITFTNTPTWLSSSGTSISGITPWETANTSFSVIVSDGSLADTQAVTVSVTQSSVFYLGMRPRSNTISVNNDATLTISINAVDSLFGITFDIEFDTSVISVDTSGALTVPQTSILYSDSTIYFYRAISTGISVSVSKVNISGVDDNVSGSGPLCQIVFTGKGSGSTDVEIDNVLIINDTGETNASLDDLVIKSSEISVQ